MTYTQLRANGEAIEPEDSCCVSFKKHVKNIAKVMAAVETLRGPASEFSYRIGLSEHAWTHCAICGKELDDA